MIDAASRPGRGGGRGGGGEPSGGAAAVARPGIVLGSFFALGTYGVVRWSALLTPRPTWRLELVLVVATLAVGPLASAARRGRRGRLIAGFSVVLEVAMALALAGIPLDLLVGAHLSTIAAGIGHGLAALPRVTVPYHGLGQPERMVIVLGAAALLLSAGMVLAFVPPRLGDGRRAGAALPLIALAVVPSTLLRPDSAYVQGLVLLGLVAALVWGERLPRGQVAPAVLLTAAAGGVGLMAAPALDRHRPLVDYQALAGGFAVSNLERFDWSQRYGPLDWPRTGKEVLDVRALRPDYWKTENLDVFRGTGWVAGRLEPGPVLPAPSPRAVRRWTQVLRVTMRGLASTEVVAAGYASAPRDVPGEVGPGQSPGTWSAALGLGPGDAYTVSTYSPRPTAADLEAVSGPYPDGQLAGYRSLMLPAGTTGLHSAPEIVFPPFGLRTPVNRVAGAPSPALASTMAASPYAPAYALARRLARAARSPYAYLASLQHFLSQGFTYSVDAPRRRYPLESFLFADRRGDCQQFSGAMALLLRMGGMPARVSAGFTTGTYDSVAHRWRVADLDAHAWVEAWFPSYGWVRFDPTPAVASIRPGRVSPSATPGTAVRDAGGTRRPRPPALPDAGSAPSPAPGRSPLGLIAAGILGAVALAAALARRRRHPTRPPAGEDPLLVELERAFVRCQRPLTPSTTLAGLERRFRDFPDVVAYLRALRLARYGGQTRRPTRSERRAVRVRLGTGLGVGGWLRALWAIPPRRPRTRFAGLSSGLKSIHGRRL